MDARDKPAHDDINLIGKCSGRWDRHENKAGTWQSRVG
jgi:hypothetical protein